MTQVFSVNFTGADDPSLTPNPFSTITEGAGNDAKYSGLGGVAVSPGMELVFGGTTSAANGEIVHATITPGSDTPYLQFALAVVNTGMMITEITDVLRLRLSATVVAKVRIVGQALPTQYRLAVQDSLGTGGTVNSATLFTQGATFHTVRLDLKGSTNQLLLYVDDVLEATCTVGSTLSGIDRANWGAVAGSVPLVTGSWFYDDLLLNDGQSGAPGYGLPSAHMGLVGMLHLGVGRR